MNASLNQNQVYDSIRERILALDLKPGSVLSEAQLAREYSVSRTPIREALIRLSGEGLIDNSARHRTLVSPIRYDDVMDGQFAREALETAIVHDVAQNMTDVIRVKLENNFKRQEKAVERKNFDRLFQLDEQMHQILASFSRRPGIWKFVVERKVHTDRIRKLTLFAEHIPNLLAQHLRIIDALNREDPNGAAQAMREHLCFIVENYHDLGRKYPQFIEAGRQSDYRGHARKTKAGRPQKLSAAQKEEVLNFLLNQEGKGYEAARRFGVSPATVSRILRESNPANQNDGTIK